MMRLWLLLLIMPLQVWATHKIEDSIAHIDIGKKSSEVTLILLSGGLVLKTSQGDKKDLSHLQLAREEKRILEFTFEDDRSVIDITTPTSVNNSPSKGASEKSVYLPSVLEDKDVMEKIFKSFRRGTTPWSQCYNRAHIWSYESKLKFNLDSMKVFMFYTSRYIRNYDFKWWFHVSPFTYIRDGETSEERVLDGLFSTEPIAMKKWTDKFMANKALCPSITKYSQYRHRQEMEDCYLLKTSMYYVQPLDLEKLERNNFQKTSWSDYEVKRAYRNAFKIYDN